MALLPQYHGYYGIEILLADPHYFMPGLMEDGCLHNQAGQCRNLDMRYLKPRSRCFLPDILQSFGYNVEGSGCFRTFEKRPVDFQKTELSRGPVYNKWSKKQKQIKSSTRYSWKITIFLSDNPF